MIEDRINCDGDYLIIAPKLPRGNGYNHKLSERVALVDNIIAFLDCHKEVTPSMVTIYELRQVNLFVTQEDK